VQDNFFCYIGRGKICRRCSILLSLLGLLGLLGLFYRTKGHALNCHTTATTATAPGLLKSTVCACVYVCSKCKIYVYQAIIH